MKHWLFLEEKKEIEEKPPKEVPLQMYGHLPNAIGGVCLGLTVGELESNVPGQGKKYPDA